MSSLLVHAGERVAPGQPIGLMGSTGRSTGSHLHFEIRYQGAPQNPLDFLH
jgi:murein DD-endopeptidase MepM/ murein hydrolase activator NlpD